MNKRQWKKACKKAALRLMRECPGRYAIRAASGHEVLRAPSAYVDENPWEKILGHYVKAPKGLLVVWECSGAWESEPECRSTSEVLEEVLAEPGTSLGRRKEIRTKHYSSGSLAQLMATA